MIAWYIVPYKRRLPSKRPRRYCAMSDYNQQIIAAGGQWTEVEILGDRAIVKMRAPASLISMADSIFKRLPKDRLNSSLSDLTRAVKQKLKEEILDMGYTQQEIIDTLGDDLGTHIFKDVLLFMASRRKKPRYDRETDEIVLDGPDQKCRSIEGVNREIQE